MRRHVTCRTWTNDQNDRLKEMVLAGASPLRASVHFKRSIIGVQMQAKKIGFPFPNRRDVKRKLRQMDSAARSNEWQSNF